MRSEGQAGCSERLRVQERVRGYVEGGAQVGEGVSGCATRVTEGAQGYVRMQHGLGRVCKEVKGITQMIREETGWQGGASQGEGGRVAYGLGNAQGGSGSGRLCGVYKRHSERLGGLREQHRCENLRGRDCGLNILTALYLHWTGGSVAISAGLMETGMALYREQR